MKNDLDSGGSSIYQNAVQKLIAVDRASYRVITALMGPSLRWNKHVDNIVNKANSNLAFTAEFTHKLSKTEDHCIYIY